MVRSVRKDAREFGFEEKMGLELRRVSGHPMLIPGPLARTDLRHAISHHGRAPLSTTPTEGHPSSGKAAAAAAAELLIGALFRMLHLAGVSQKGETIRAVYGLA